MSSLFRISIVASLLVLSSCASTSSRHPSSVQEDTQSAEFAQKLNGGSLKFRAFRDKNDISLLGFLELKFRNCQVEVNGEYNKGDPARVDEGSFINCDVDVSSDPIRGTVKARIKGDKRNFTAKVVLEKNNEYSLDAEVTLAWQASRWTGSGTVNGWINKKVGRGGTLTATVRESLSF
jgi:hypothetical protein